MSHIASLPRTALATTLLTLVAGAFGALAPGVAGAADPPRYKPYYGIFDRGATPIPAANTKWVPQGLTYWPERDALLISYYDGDKASNSRIVAIDRSSGREITYWSLQNKSHVGGLAMSGRFLWVAGEGGVTRIAKQTLEITPRGRTLGNSGRIGTLASSYATINGNKLWVGDFDKDVAYRYAIRGANEKLRLDKRIRTPGEVQGMAVVGGKIVWSRSYGRDNDSKLEVGTLSSPTPHGGGLLAPNMSEGIVAAKGELHVLYESGSSHYGDADYRVKTVHHAPIGKVLAIP